MKKTEIKKLKGLSNADLMKDLVESREALRKMQFELAQGKIKNVQLMREAKKRIARVSTFLNQNQTAQNNGTK